MITAAAVVRSEQAVQATGRRAEEAKAVLRSVLEATPDALKVI